MIASAPVLWWANRRCVQIGLAGVAAPAAVAVCAGTAGASTVLAIPFIHGWSRDRLEELDFKNLAPEMQHRLLVSEH